MRTRCPASRCRLRSRGVAAGKVSRDDAANKAALEYEQFAPARRALPSPVEKHFEEAVSNVKQLGGQRSAHDKAAADEQPPDGEG